MGDVAEKMWAEIGRKSFARYFDLSWKEVKEMEDNPNSVLLVMMEEMTNSLRGYENYVVKTRKPSDKIEDITRADLLDI